MRFVADLRKPEMASAPFSKPTLKAKRLDMPSDPLESSSSSETSSHLTNAILMGAYTKTGRAAASIQVARLVIETSNSPEGGAALPRTIVTKQRTSSKNPVEAGVHRSGLRAGRIGDFRKSRNASDCQRRYGIPTMADCAQRLAGGEAAREGYIVRW
jgi:hypothetical protein